MRFPSQRKEARLAGVLSGEDLMAKFTQGKSVGTTKFRRAQSA